MIVKVQRGEEQPASDAIRQLEIFIQPLEQLISQAAAFLQILRKLILFIKRNETIILFLRDQGKASYRRRSSECHPELDSRRLLRVKLDG